MKYPNQYVIKIYENGKRNYYIGQVIQSLMVLLVVFAIYETVLAFTKQNNNFWLDLITFLFVGISLNILSLLIIYPKRFKQIEKQYHELKPRKK